MNNIRYINKSLIVICLVIFSAFFVSCSDWTDTKVTDTQKPNLETQNPKAYAEYLENLRNYKAGDHKIVYATFDNNPDEKASRAYNIASIPDSVDIVSLIHPYDLSQANVDEMEDVQEDKATKFLLNINFDAISYEHQQMMADYEEELARVQAIIDAAEKEKENGDGEGEGEGEGDGEGEGEGEPEEPQEPEEIPELPEKPVDFITYLVDKMQVGFKAVKQYNYNGLSVTYNGRNTRHMDEEEYAEYINKENVFLGIIDDWYGQNSGLIMVMEGSPQNVVNKSLLELFNYIIIPCSDVQNGSAIVYRVTLALAEGVPADRILVSAITTSLDPTDARTGWWANGSNALISTANWVAKEHTEYDIVGIAIENVNYDYFQRPVDYQNVRQAIDILNPSIKK